MTGVVLGKAPGPSHHLLLLQVVLEKLQGLSSFTALLQLLLNGLLQLLLEVFLLLLIPLAPHHAQRLHFMTTLRDANFTKFAVDENLHPGRVVTCLGLDTALQLRQSHLLFQGTFGTFRGQCQDLDGTINWLQQGVTVMRLVASRKVSSVTRRRQRA